MIWSIWRCCGLE